MTETTAPREEVVAGALSWLGRWLLLVPEAALLSILLLLYVALNVPLGVAILAALLVTSFTIRTLALHLAQLHIGAGHYHDAEALLWVAHTLYPYSADTLALQGTLAMARGELEQAEQALREAVRLLPGQPSFYIALSGTLIDLGRPAEAAMAARQALRLDDQAAQAYLFLAEAEQARGTASNEVEAHLRTGITLTRTPAVQAALQCSLAAHLLGAGRFAEATLALHVAEGLVQHCGALHQAQLRYHISELLVIQGLTERAREQNQHAEAINADDRFNAAPWRSAHPS